MKRAWPVVLLLCLVISAGCSGNPTDLSEPEKFEDSQPRYSVNGVETLAKNLQVPWDIIKRGETFYVSERPGRIVKIMPGGKAKMMPLILEEDVSQQGEGGLLGFVLSPDFQSSQIAFIYHTYRANNGAYNRIVKIKKTNQRWVEQGVLLEGIPAGIIHNGGRLEIGPDGKLYATTGDASNEENAQDLGSLSGKILRMNPDGSIPGDNPFPDSYIYSYGHRNPQGMAWSEDGKMYSAEHGSSAHDEINLIVPGKNYGWPVIRGNEKKEGMVSPLFQSGEDTWAPSGLAYHEGELYVAGLRGMQIRAFDLDAHTSRMVFEGVGRLRDIIIKDGVAYVITNNTDGRGNPRPGDDRLLQLNLDNLD